MSSSRSSQNFEQETVMQVKRPFLQAQRSKGASTPHNGNSTSSIIRQTITFIIAMAIGGLLVTWALACIGAWQYISNQAPAPMVWGSASPPATVPATIIDPPVKTSAGDCGKTRQEAKMLGCEFDIMITGWSHPKCIDRELSNHYLHEGGPDGQPWKFYWDQEAAMEIPTEEVVKGDYDAIYSTWAFHQAHCGYLWAQVHREQLTKPVGQRVLPKDAWDVTHINHCIEFVSFQNWSHILETDIKLLNHVSGCLIA